MVTLNTLILLTDEQDAHALGCAGHPFVKTPHLDALAARGTRFTQALTPSPICVPARAALATGRWVHDIAYWDNAMGYDGRVAGWGHALQAAGHCVESIGKLHYANAAAPTGFSVQHDPLHLADGIGQVIGDESEAVSQLRGVAADGVDDQLRSRSPIGQIDRAARVELAITARAADADH